MSQQDLYTFLTVFQGCHEELRSFSYEALTDVHLGDEVDLSHHYFINRHDGAMEVESLHRFAISIGPNFSAVNEIDVTASIRVSLATCSARTSIQARLDKEAGGFSVGSSTIQEKFSGDVDLAEAIKFLRQSVSDLGELSELLAPFARPRP
ncbi:hypothetical protein ACFP1Z_00050 [Streptomyces gamaensis]|uniref:Uncharacterized protein n=1 Tax=Streptomyces gamaensis TaxID=1763542 RepID=A0ABW0YSR1_9ACTN